MTVAKRPIIHILGLGSMGTVLAVDLIRFTNALVIPLFRSKEKLDKFQIEGHSKISIRKLYEEKKPLVECKVEEAQCPETFNSGIIENLVITTKTYQTKEALAPYLKYINSHTNLILIQNGLGVLEVLKDEVFVNKSERPQLFQGVISHGVYQESGFTYAHAGWAGMKVARLPWNDDEMIQTNSLVKRDYAENELVNLLMSQTFAKEFGMEHMSYQEMLLGQLFKFLVNCCMNPVTAIVDCVNGEMVDYCAPVFRSIIDECLTVLRVAYKPLFAYENQYKGNEDYVSLTVDSILNTEHMVKEVIRIGCDINERNSSSMRQDTLYLRDTEIDYINGYVVDLAKKYEMGAAAANVNKTISELVNLRLGLNRTRAQQGDWRQQ
ncbi:2-dehydropantoate 2-reductase PAN5 NDAI_0C02070 [Naumovozyma dairenensis CBS 421]|uniref:2-dehydropantoate 2-reductase n=1 Tax=Naumovozyma dairenensis (strain ATCC 10597 / BCRC 20456 / CBS 421 / NBRC 0211 / NRRL Y-12639) TaxID=1071378 RepID=G0W7V6_NAUDC|nr:hypothetical protein NDAI_0C02070 [Naumovozyma dairenensis CBS 421]CCD23867.1 hypothetical protein NDAI_0C02070 [Naumovozyma dairenensis CBS 421]